MQTAVPPPQEAEYDDLLGLWSDLEAGLDTLLREPRRIPDFAAKVRQYDRWMQDLLAQDTDVGLYLLFQLASDRSLGYSSAHALICAVLCHVLAHDMALPTDERDSLVAAAMTMNVAMTALQNQLAEQAERLSSAQQRAVRQHSEEGRQLLAEIGVNNALWLEIVAQHHDTRSAPLDPSACTPAERLAHVLCMVDRYGAMISPRKTRAGRSVTETVRAMVTRDDGLRDPVAVALVRSIGLCPPGTFVRMESGETAVVLRRGKANLPLVAYVVGSAGGRLFRPRLHRTASGPPGILSALTREQVSDPQQFNHQLLLRLGLQVDRAHGAG